MLAQSPYRPADVASDQRSRESGGLNELLEFPPDLQSRSSFVGHKRKSQRLSLDFSDGCSSINDFLPDCLPTLSRGRLSVAEGKRVSAVNRCSVLDVKPFRRRGEPLAQSFHSSPSRRSTRHVNPDIPINLLRSLWKWIDPGVGYLGYMQVLELLSELGVEADEWTLNDFFQVVDVDSDRRITFEEFYPAFTSFRQQGKFEKTASSLRLACMVASREGRLNFSRVFQAWQKYDVDGNDRLDCNELRALVNDLGLPSTTPYITELIEEMDTDLSGTIEFTEFASLFSYEPAHQKAAERLYHVHRVGAGKNLFAQPQFHDTNQEKAMRRLRWYTGPFQWIMFVYLQLSLAVPIFLTCSEPFRVEVGTWTRVLVGALCVTDVVMGAKVYLRLTVPGEESGQMVLDPAVIRRLYVGSWEFRVDVLAGVPLEVLAGACYPPLFLHPVLRLNKLLLLGRVNDVFQRAFSEVLGPKWWRIVNALYLWGVIAHLVACLFFVVARHEGDEHTKAMLTVEGYSRLSVQHQYLQALSYAINTMAGLSRGVIPPGDLQMVFATCTVLLGVGVYSLMLAVVSYALTVETQESKFRNQLDEMKDILCCRRLPTSFVDEVLTYHKHVFAATGQVHLGEEEELVADLPADLAVGMSLYNDWSFFRSLTAKTDDPRDVDAELIYCLKGVMRPAVVPPATLLYDACDDTGEVYLLRKGQCEAFFANSTRRSKMLTMGAVIGRLASAKYDTPSEVVTASYCCLWVVRKDDLADLHCLFPSLRKKLNKAQRSSFRSSRKNIRAASMRKLTMPTNPLRSPPNTGVLSRRLSIPFCNLDQPPSPSLPVALKKY